MSRNERVSCESCTYYIYDEDYESYVCDKNMDEDEVCSYIKKTFKELLLLWKNSENNMGR